MRAPGDDVVLGAWQSLSTRLRATRVELLIGDEGNAFASTGDARADLLAITAVHPMREDAVAELLARAAAGWPLVEHLVSEGLLARREHQGRTFYMRRALPVTTHALQAIQEAAILASRRRSS